MVREFHHDALVVRGCAIPGNSCILLKPVKGRKSCENGFLRAHNTSSEVQYLMPSKKAQEQVKNQWPEFKPEIAGDELSPSLPMAWNNPLIKFEILSLNNSLMPGVGERVLEDINRFTQPGSMWTMQEIVCAVKSLPGSPPPGPKNPTNFMGYYRTMWQVYKQAIQEGVVSDVDGIVTDDSHIEAKQHSISRDEVAYVLDDCFGNYRMAFVVKKSDGVCYQHKGDRLELFLDSIGTSGCISLLQKAIRRRPKQMEHPETRELYDTLEIVDRIVRRMCCGKQRGFFLPNIGKFVTPLEHFLKRLYIIAAEDSEYSIPTMYFLSMKAFLAARLPHWKPPTTLVERLVTVTKHLLKSSITSRFDTSKCETLSRGFMERAPSAVHLELGGMDGDQNMLRWLARHPCDRNSIGIAGQPLLGIDPLDIYCDHHQEGRLVCFLQNPQTGSQPKVYGKALSDAFFAVSGLNTRRTPRPQELSRFETMVFDALRACSKLLRLKPPALPQPTSCRAFKEWVVHDGSLSGMVGSIEVPHERGKYFVTVSVHNLLHFIVIPKPSRDNKRSMGDIDNHQREAIIEKARAVLRKGVRASNVPDPSFHNATIRLDGNTWTLNGIPWDKAKKVSSQLVKPLEWSKIQTPRRAAWPWTKTFGAGQVFRPETIQWCVSRMAGFDTTVTIPKINREGAGTDEALTGLEAEGYQYMLHLSHLFPDALWPSKPFTFRTNCIAVRKELCQHLSSAHTSVCRWPKWSSELKLRPGQEQAFVDMKEAWDQGLACFLYMLVGQGKTLSVLSFLQDTRASRFIIWSLPKSAVGSVAEIIKEVGWSPLLLFPSIGLKRKYDKEDGRFPSTDSSRLQDEVVHLVEHDHLRSLADRLAEHMVDCTFVFDEVHKAMMSGTQRTSSALRLARLAKQLVALTGTPIVDKSGYGLMEWLRLVVPFPVSASNFWVAANSMVKQLNAGEVEVTEIVEQAEETEDETKFFKENFPTRPPWFGETETPSRASWMRMRELTREICDRALVDIAIQMYQRHPKDWKKDHFDSLQFNRGGGERPLIVGADQDHCCRLIHMMLKGNVKPNDILLVGGTRPSGLKQEVEHAKTIHLTEQRVVVDEQEKPFKIVVAALRNCEGYSLTWMTCQLTGSYPSNQASRTQMKGRIHRLDAQRRDKKYVTVLSGITTITHRHQEAAKLMEDALRAAPAKRMRKS